MNVGEKTVSKLTPTQAVDRLRALVQKMDAADKLVLKLLVHPEATMEQIMQVREVMMHVHHQYRTAYQRIHQMQGVRSLRWDDAMQSLRR